MKTSTRRWRRQWQPTPVLLPGKSHGRRSLVGCSHGVAKSQTLLSDFTFTFHFHALEKEMATHSSVLAWKIPGTGEPPGCRWTAVFGVEQSRTRLKRLSSSSSSTRRRQIPFSLTGFPDSSVGKESACNTGDPGLIPGLGRCTRARDRLPTPVSKSQT